MQIHFKDDLSERQKYIIQTYIELLQSNLTLPSLTMLNVAGISRDQVRAAFGNITELHKYISENFDEHISPYILTKTHVHNKKKLKQLQDSAKKYRRFVITTFVNNKPIHQGFLKSIRSYCTRNDACLMVIPCDNTSKTHPDNWVFPPELISDVFVFEDIALNENLFVSSIKVSARQILPTTGLGRIGQRNGSYIFASPKHQLDYVVNSPNPEKLPHAIMTTGAITLPEYRESDFMTDRISYIAESDHVIGAIIVEIENEKIFHFRQVQADENGAFIDLGVQYNPDGEVASVPATIVLGDWHSKHTDPKVMESFVDIVRTIDIDKVFIHDFFDGYSISHHDLNIPVKMARKANDDRLSLEQEIIEARNDLAWFLKVTTADIFIVKGNHDEFLDRYLMNGSYVVDPNNHYVSLFLAPISVMRGDPLQYAIEQLAVSSELERTRVSSDRVTWLQRDEEYKVGGVELAVHGDLGLNGARGSLQQAERAYGNCVIGHSHSAAILRGVYRVGTSTHLKLDYNRGPSSWTQTHCLVYENGGRQLINIINGEWRVK